MIKLVIFDLDGVLASTSIEHFSAWKKVIKNEFGITIKDSVEELTKGVSRMDSLERILESINKENIHLKDKQRLSDNKNKIYVEMIKNYDEDNLFSGVVELFMKLKEHNIKIALGSASKNGTNIVRNLGIYSMFDYIVNPAKNKSKPNPDIFLDACNHFGFKPVECIGVEDAQAGIEAINSAGMISIGITKESLLDGYDYAFKEVREIDDKIFLQNR